MGAGGLAGIIAGGLAAESKSGAAVASAAVMRNGIELQVGQRFARWTITAIHPVRDGALHIDVKGADDHAFVLELLAPDSSALAPHPPAATEGLAIFVRNGGDGWLPTAEEQGLAAMTLADLLSKTGQGGPIAGLLTYSERFARHHETLTGEEPNAMVHLV